MNEGKTFNKQDVARLLKAQSPNGKYCPRKWLQDALSAGWSSDDICHLIATPCDILAKMYRDLECDYLLRACCRSECEDRRKYGLPASGGEYIPSDYKPKEKRKKQSFSDSAFFDYAERTQGKYIGFSDLMYRNTANRVSVFAHLDRIGRNLAIAGQSERLAQRLEKLGIDAYRKLQGQFVKRGLLTGLVAPVAQQFRNILFIPSVAVSNRSKLKKELQFFIEHEIEKPEYLRFLVITGGRNVPFYGDLRGHHKRMSRKISSAFKELGEKYGAEIHFRGTEETVNNRASSINLHYNVLYHVPFISEEKGGMAAFLDDLRSMVGCMVQDQGVIRNLDEVVKYVCKPNDIESLDDEALLWFYNELKNSHQFQAYGAFQSFRRELKEKRLRVVFDNSTKKLFLMLKRQVNDDDIWEGKKEDCDKYQAKPLVDDFGRDIFAAFLAEKNMLHDAFMSGEEFASSELMEENKIVGLMLPHCAFFNVSEPCLLIRNYTEQPTSEIGRKALDLIGKLSKQLRDGVQDKLESLGCRALQDGDFQGFRRSFATGNKDIDQVDLYNLDTLHDNSHPPPRRQPRASPKPFQPPRYGAWEQGLKAPVSVQ